MKLIYVLVFFVVFSLSAQQHPIGFKVGANVPTLAGGGTQNVSSSLSFNAGVYMELIIDEKVAFQPELLYTGYGFKLNDQGTESNISLNYLAFSVLSKIFLTQSLSLDAGPQFGILVSANDRTDELPNVKSDFYNRDFGVNIGLGYGITEKIIASFSYYIGVTDVTTSENKNFNRAFQIAFQYKIN